MEDLMFATEIGKDDWKPYRTDPVVKPRTYSMEMEIYKKYWTSLRSITGSDDATLLWFIIDAFRVKCSKYERKIEYDDDEESDDRVMVARPKSVHIDKSDLNLMLTGKRTNPGNTSRISVCLKDLEDLGLLNIDRIYKHSYDQFKCQNFYVTKRFRFVPLFPESNLQNSLNESLDSNPKLWTLTFKKPKFKNPKLKISNDSRAAFFKISIQNSAAVSPIGCIPELNLARKSDNELIINELHYAKINGLSISESKYRDWIRNTLCNRYISLELDKKKVEEYGMANGEPMKVNKTLEQMSLWPTFGDNDHRLYHHYTGLTKNLRKSVVLMDNETTEELFDLHNSRCYMLLHIIEQFPEEVGQDELKRFREFVERERTYEEVWDFCNSRKKRKAKRMYPADRIDMKKDFQRYICSKESKGKVNTKTHSYFKAHFPSVDAILMRSGIWAARTCNEEIEEMTTIAYLMEREYGVKCLLVHDSIWTTASNHTALNRDRAEAFFRIICKSTYKYEYAN